MIDSRADEPLIATPVEAEVKAKKFRKGPGLFKRLKGPEKKEPAPPEEKPRYVAVPVAPQEIPVAKKSRSDALSSLIEEALQRNPELLSVRQDQIIKLAQSEFTGKDAFPLIAAYGTHDSQPGATFGVPGRIGGGESKRDAYGLMAEQALLDWGETRGKIQMERSQAKSHFWHAKVKELETVYHVTEVYWRLVFFKEVVALRESALAAKRREKAAVLDRVKAREARNAELLLVDAGVAQAEQELLKAKNGYDLSAAQLLFYIGRDRNDCVTVNERLSVSRRPGIDLVDVECHPEMQRVRAAEMAASSAERAARAGRLPKVVLRGHVEESNSQETIGTTNLLPDGSNYQVGAYVSVPVGRQRVAANAKLNEAYARQIQLAADAATLNGSLQLRIKEAQNRVEEALNSVTVAKKNAAAATENLKLRKELALIKNATRADVAKAENEFNEAKVGVLKAMYDVKEAQAHLDREAGMINP
ncbi:MAG: TolC family protein [Verrucomicrobiales bacterium]|nr:TolC family protein [Verrucomicrobiales bacterium]